MINGYCMGSTGHGSGKQSTRCCKHGRLCLQQRQSAMLMVVNRQLNISRDDTCKQTLKIQTVCDSEGTTTSEHNLSGPYLLISCLCMENTVPARLIGQHLACLTAGFGGLQEHFTGAGGQHIEGLGIRVALLDDISPSRNLQRCHAIKDCLLGGPQKMLKQQVLLCGSLCMQH